MKKPLVNVLFALFVLLLASNAAKSQYCSANAAGTCYHYLGQVVFGSINQVTNCVDYTSFYRDWTSQSNTITQGTAQNITLYNTSVWGCYFRVWIDWNQDFDFLDAGENVIVAGPVAGLTNYTVAINCPATATIGATRMRIKADYYNNFGGGPCASSNETETQDYTVVVAAAAPGTVSGTLNTYTAVTGICSSDFTVASASGFSVGDKIMVIQMRGTSIDLSNTSSFGSISSLGTTGLYEFFIIGSITGSVITTTALPQTAFNVAGQVQMIRVAYYTFPNTTVTSATCPAWNGSTGGVIVIETPNTLTINGTIDASGRGFRGGAPDNAAWGCNNPASYGYVYVATSTYSAPRGEGIGSQLINAGNTEGRGNAANGGGAGNNVNAGGGGGANIGVGGMGGFQWASCGDPTPAQTQGIPGVTLNTYYSNALNRIYMGGGGGGGHAGANVSGGGAGANGGGIIILRAGAVDGSGSVLATGNAGITVNGQWAGGGGGAGGTILISSPSVSGNIMVNTSGGKGGDAFWPNQVGPGGGGGGGLLWVSGGAVPPAITYTSNGGTNGLWTNGAAAWGATSGTSGSTLTGLVLPAMSITPPITCSVLPVEWIDINGACTHKKSVNVTWKVVAATTTSHFIVTRSVNGTDFSPVGEVNVNTGTSNYYEFEDTNLPDDNVFYRITEVNTLGTVSFSPITSVNAGNCIPNEWDVYPNPASTVVEIVMKGKEFKSGTTVEILNVQGKLLMTQTTGNSDEHFSINIEHLPAGLYLLRVNEQVKNFIVTR